MSSDRLEWMNRGDFTRIVVHALPTANGAILEHSIRHTPSNDAPGLLSLSGCVVRKGVPEHQVTAYCDRESNACLALNAAHAIMVGQASAEPACATYEETVKLRGSGKQAEASERLLFRAKSPAGLIYDSESNGYTQFD